MERLLPVGHLAPVGAVGSFPLAQQLPGWRSIAPVQASYVATGDRCTDGWKLGEEESVCDLGAVAAFPSPSQAETLWRPAAGARVVGFAISGP
ncbi:MAG: hypothetical protein WD670_05460, partial [Actinomycetota bacterium]